MSGKQIIITKPVGGLGNRIINLISSTFLSRLLKCELYVYWRPCHLCDCNFNDIFDTTGINIISTHEEYEHLEKVNNITIVGHTPTTPDNYIDRYNKGKLHISLADKTALEKKQIIIHKSVILPPFITIDDIVDILGCFRFKAEIYREACNFITTNNISHKDKGYHGRFTDCYNRKKDYDSLNTVNKQHMKDVIVADTNTRYFVCSCEKELENALSNYANIVYRAKAHYPVFYTSYEAFRNTSPRRIHTYITQETLFPLNYISKKAVIDGIIDMLILSRTNMVKAIPSTFWDLASWYSQVHIGKNIIKINNKIIRV